MKTALVFSVFVVLVRGSLFGEFQEAMSSLKSGFQKLITDVVTDVEETIDCTIIAVETAFSIGSVVSSRFNSKCKGVIKQNKDKYETLKTADNSSEHIFIDKQENDYLISNVLKYLEAINKKGVVDGQSKRSNFGSEHNLNKVVVFLQKEIEKFSFNINEELTIVEADQKSTIDCIVNYINLLQSLESKSKKVSELKEVQRIMDGVSKILDISVNNENIFNTSSTSLELKSDDEINDTQSTDEKSNSETDSELNQARLTLENTSKIVRVNIISNVHVNDEFKEPLTSLEPQSNFKNNDSRLNEDLTKFNNASKTASVSNVDANDKELKVITLAPIFNNENNGTQSTDKSKTTEISSNQTNSNLSTVTEALLITESNNINTEKNDEQMIYETENSASDDIDVDSLDYESFFGGDSDGNSNEDTWDEARKMLQDNQSLNPIINEIFSRADQSDNNILDDQF